MFSPGLRSIGSGAFALSPSLTRLDFPPTLTSIGECAFADCTALVEVVIPEGVATIETEAFNGCPALKRIVLPRGLVSIRDGAFRLLLVAPLVQDACRFSAEPRNGICIAGRESRPITNSSHSRNPRNRRLETASRRWTG